MQAFFLLRYNIVLPEFYNISTAITLRVTKLYFIYKLRISNCASRNRVLCFICKYFIYYYLLFQ